MLDWIGKHWERILLIFLFISTIGNFLYTHNKIHVLVNHLDLLLFGEMAPIPKTVELDFSNKTGAARIQSSFTDLLINSEGSEKKGEGYTVFFQTTNPSSILIYNSDIIFSWKHNGFSQAATINNPNDYLVPGKGVTQTAYLSPLEGDELKNINVKIDYELMKHY